MKKIVVAAAALVKNGQLFIAQRPANKLPPLVWEFPGGKVENSETLPQALKRELREELGVETRIGKFIAKVTHLYDFAEVEINLFWAELLDPFQEIIDVEHADTAWVSFNELDQYEFAAADVDLIEKLKETNLRF